MTKRTHTFDAWIASSDSVWVDLPKRKARDIELSLTDPRRKEGFREAIWGVPLRDGVPICPGGLLRLLGLDYFDFRAGDKMKVRVTVEYDPDEVETIEWEEE